jgi:hypothetical protein
MYKGAPGLDDFYLLRGCNVISKPAFLHLNPLARAFLKLCLPGSYEKIVGHIVPPEPRWPSDELASEPHHLPAQGSAGSLREQQNSRIWTNQEQSRQPKTA